MKLINYSVIIPHYNAPDLLQRCLNSIPTREDLEIIVVDDNSDPLIVDFNEFPGKDRLDVKLVFLKTSKGAGAARNTGILHSQGKWLLFADSDDFFTIEFPGFLNKYSTSQYDDVDVVYLNSQYFYEKTGELKPTVFSRYIERYLQGKLYSEQVLRYNMWTPWSRMVKCDLVKNNKLKFEEIPVGNDKMFSLLCSKNAKKIKCESIVLYNYYMPTSGSVTNSLSLRNENIKCKIDLLFRTKKLYEEVGYVFRPSIIYEFLIDKANVIDGQRRSLYFNSFKRKEFCVIGDLYYMFIYIVGKLLNVL